LNFSFIRHIEEYDRKVNLEIICNVMKDFGIDLQINKRHDLTVNYKDKTYKVSGSAFRHKKDRAFHHGTLLISCETHRLKESTIPGNNKKIIQATGTNSIRSEVINLNRINPELTVDSIIEGFKKKFDGKNEGKLKKLSEDEWMEFSESEPVQRERDNLLSEDWILGKTPAFIQDISTLHQPESEGWLIRINKGKIESTPEELSFLIGIEYGRRHSYDDLKIKFKKHTLFEMGKDELFSRLIDIIG
jgi:lipoate-protein ligase A